MKKTLFAFACFSLMATLSSAAPKLPVCIIMTCNLNYPDKVDTLYCDGKAVVNDGECTQSATTLLQQYLGQGYKIQGQSESDYNISYTLVK